MVAFAKSTEHERMSKQESIRRARQTTLLKPMLAEMVRRTKLSIKPGEVEGKLVFHVDQANILCLPPGSPAKNTLFRRFDGLSHARIDDDSSYYDSVQEGNTVTVILPLPAKYEKGGWRCHALLANGPCLQPNLNDHCMACNAAKPQLKREFLHLRMISHSVRCQADEYLRIIFESDDVLTKCESACESAEKRLAAVTEKNQRNNGATSSDGDDEEEDELMMNVELAETGVWNRVSAKTVLSAIQSRKVKATSRLNWAKASLAIMIQSSYELAAPHTQKLVRGFLVRAYIGKVRGKAQACAQFSAAVEIQRTIRSYLATMEKARKWMLKRNLMATKIQCTVRSRAACIERKRLWSFWLENLQFSAATKIQSFCRGYLSKLKANQIAEEKSRHLKEQEKARRANREHEAATLIQSNARRCICTAQCLNKRIELGLHSRILMYLERFNVDGSFFHFLKSINDDYLRFEKTISSTIEREEKLSKTFVEKVVRLRDADHTNAWEKYCSYKRSDENVSSCELDAQQTKQKFVSHTAIMKKLHHDDENRRSSVNDGRSWERSRDFTKTSKLYGSSRRRTAQRSRLNNRMPKGSATSKIKPIEPAASTPHNDGSSIVAHSDEIIGEMHLQSTDEQHRRHASRLIKINQLKDRLRGQYIRFDIPNGLDDTVARFVTAIALRYNATCPETSSLHNASFTNGIATAKEPHQECLAYAESLIQQLHAQGIVFIRQLLPMDHMSNVLSDFNAPEEFVTLAYQLLLVLQQMTGGNFMTRRYLMGECRHFLTTHKKLVKSSATPRRQEIGDNILSRFGEFGGDDVDENDVPGGLWMSTEAADSNQSRTTLPSTPLGASTACIQTNKGRRHKNWAVTYTNKVKNHYQAKNPAYSQYRNYDLLARNN